MAIKTKQKKTKAAANAADAALPGNVAVGDVVVTETSASEDNTAKQKIAPRVIPLSGGHEDLLPPSTGFRAYAGEHHVIALGPNGEEVEGSDFSYPPGRSFERAFASNPKFKIKKKSSTSPYNYQQTTISKQLPTNNQTI